MKKKTFLVTEKKISLKKLTFQLTISTILNNVLFVLSGDEFLRDACLALFATDMIEPVCELAKEHLRINNHKGVN